MAMNAATRLAYLEKWARLHYASYMRYARDHGLAWTDKLAFDVRTLVETYTAEQDVLYAEILEAIHAADGVEPPLGYLEDVAYLNYVHLPLIFSRAVNRCEALAPQIAVDVAACLEAGEFELADLGQKIEDQFRAQAKGLRPYCGNEGQMSPA